MIEIPRIRLTPLTIEALDMRPAQNEIRVRYGRGYHINDDCLQEVAALWGIARQHDCINASGVFIPYDRIECRAGRCSAEIRFASSPSGLWAMDTSYMTVTCGGGSSPSVWNGVAFLSEDDARAAGVHALIELFRNIAAAGKSEAADARKLIQMLEEARTPQLSLF